MSSKVRVPLFDLNGMQLTEREVEVDTTVLLHRTNLSNREVTRVFIYQSGSRLGYHRFVEVKHEIV